MEYTQIIYSVDEHVAHVRALLEPVVASMSLPGVFPPVTIDGRQLVDGAVASNVPFASALERGARRAPEDLDIKSKSANPPHIGLDGFNLALEQGTGIATYARNLSHVLKDSGAHVDVLYGRSLPYRKGLLREMAFFDPIGGLHINSVLPALAAAMRSLAPIHVGEVPITGQVVADDFRPRLPAFDRLFEQMKNLDNGPERQAVIDRMVTILRDDAPWAWGFHPKDYGLYHAWLTNVKPNQMARNSLKSFDQTQAALAEKRSAVAALARSISPPI